MSTHGTSVQQKINNPRKGTDFSALLLMDKFPANFGHNLNMGGGYRGALSVPHGREPVTYDNSHALFDRMYLLYGYNDKQALIYE